MSQTLSAAHWGSIGDTWAAIPAMREFSRKTGKKLVLYLGKDIPAIYYEGAVHPTKNSEGVQVMLNQDMINMMKPLFMAQPFIEDVIIHEEGMKIDLDLNVIRETFVNMPYHSLSKWYFYVYPDLTCDISQPYMNVPDGSDDTAKDKIIIARSERYRNDTIDYSFLKSYEDNLLFSGTMREYNNFCMTFDLNIPKLHITNFLELAQALKKSKGLISNQTQIFQIAEGIKMPRAVELCRFAPNVCTQGKNGYEYYNAYAAEYFLNVMLESVPDFFERLKKEITAGAVNPNALQDK